MFYAWISVNHACFIATWCGRLMQILCRLCGAKVIIYSNICPYTSVSSIPCIKKEPVSCIAGNWCMEHTWTLDSRIQQVYRLCMHCMYTHVLCTIHAWIYHSMHLCSKQSVAWERECMCMQFENLNVLWMAYDMDKLQVLKVLCIIGPAHGSTHCISAKSKVSIWTLLELIWLNKMWWWQTWQFFTTHFCA